MKRRRALQTLLAASSARAQDTGALVTANAEAVGSPKLSFFSSQEMEKVRAIAGEIFPAFEGKPGANQAGVPEFLDYLLSRSPAADQKLYREGLAAVAALDDADRPWTYAEPHQLGARFLRRFKDDVLRATFNSRVWIEASGRRGGGVNYYWKPVD